MAWSALFRRSIAPQSGGLFQCPCILILSSESVLGDFSPCWEKRLLFLTRLVRFSGLPGCHVTGRLQVLLELSGQPPAFGAQGFDGVFPSTPGSLSSLQPGLTPHRAWQGQAVWARMPPAPALGTLLMQMEVPHICSGILRLLPAVL